jgi:hypothetical protein
MANYYKEFLKSPAHAWTAVLTVGAGLATANPIGLIVGGAAYALAWIYFPDSKGFKARIEKLRAAEELQKAKQGTAARKEHLSEGLSKLQAEDRKRFEEFQKLGRDIANSIGSRSSSGLYPVETLTDNLHEIETTYLRLLNQRSRLKVFVTRERKEPMDLSIENAVAETATLQAQVEALEKADPEDESLRTRRRTLELQQTRIETLRQRKKRLENAEANLELVEADLARIEGQLKLLLADAASRLDSDSFSHQIDASMQHLSQTNQWLSELESTSSAFQ